MKRLDRFKTYTCKFPNKGSLFELTDVAIKSYFRLSDEEFENFFIHFNPDELEDLIPIEKTTQTSSERRNVSKMLTNFYNKN